MSSINFYQKISLALLMGSVMCACSMQDPTVAQYRQEVSAWLGRTPAELISAWGTPTQVFMKNNTQYMVYIVDKHVELPGVEDDLGSGQLQYVSPLEGTPAYDVSIFCQTTFLAINDVITDYLFEGDGCKAR